MEEQYFSTRFARQFFYINFQKSCIKRVIRKREFFVEVKMKINRKEARCSADDMNTIQDQNNDTEAHTAGSTEIM